MCAGTSGSVYGILRRSFTDRLATFPMYLAGVRVKFIECMINEGVKEIEMHGRGDTQPSRDGHRKSSRSAVDRVLCRNYGSAQPHLPKTLTTNAVCRAKRERVSLR